ncbi:MAG: ribonuclease III [Clostridia bacterium]|nr:ribonuclease III [Clostridia bacterium]MEE1185640.1 ribonuclease III domain-containing protein [Acutalibacteraceae bacterium]
MDKVKQLSPSVLAFVGDGVYGLFVRTKLSEVNRPSGELHKMSVQYVNASSQAKAYEIIADALTENEMGIFKRGRNFQTHSAPKSSTLGEYHTATGLECLFGYLYLSGENERAKELFELIWNNLF